MAKQFISIEKNFDLSRINFDFSKELNLSSGIIIKDIVKKNKSGKDINGNAIKPLKQSTITAKKLKGSSDPSRALFDTGRMVGRGSAKGVGGRGPFLSQRASKMNQTAIVSVAGDRGEIGRYHNDGDGVPQREWFGISKDAEKNIIRMIKLRIDEMIRRA